jgi:hypothetical protein
MAVWPLTLPQYPLLDGFSYQPPNLLVASESDTGPPMVRRRTTAGHAKVQCAWLLTGTQFATFRAFYETELAGGAVPFTMPHPLDETTCNAMFDPASVPTYNALKVDVWRVDAALLILP